MLRKLYVENYALIDRLEMELGDGLNIITGETGAGKTILLGALKAIRELRLRIPDDISVLSFDNYEYLDYLDPSVTRISQPSAEIGAQAMEILLRRINGDAPQAVQLRLAPSLVACRSVKRL